MTKKQIEELRKARDREFQSDDEEVRKSMRELNHFIDVMEEEGWNRNEAIVFLANTCRPK